jgi:hypothetical protein
MTRNATTAQVPQPDAAQPTAVAPWFTADEIPMPPPEMRRPPGQEEPTLFDDAEEDESTESLTK